MKRHIPTILTLLLSLMLHSCTPFAPEQRTHEQNLMPTVSSNALSALGTQQKWWKTFNDVQLDELVDEALKNNPSLHQSWARLKQIQALAVRSGSNKYPDLTLNGEASVGRRQTANGQVASDTVESYALGLFSNYEIDLWGRIRSENEAAALSVEASKEDIKAAALTLTANVTSRWIGILSQRMQKQLLERQLKANKILAELVELRFRKSLASALDVFQQRQLVAQSRAQIPLVERNERQLLNELTLLLGRTSFEIPQIKSQRFELPTEVPVRGIPAQLLTARPDIQAALKRVEVADWTVAAAKADRLPSLNLRAGATYRAEELNLLLDNWLINLAGNLTAPLLDGRRRKAEVERLKAVVNENLAQYRQTVLTALREVEDAIVDEEKLRAHIEGLQTQLNAAQKALHEARSRYRSGLSDYLPVLTQVLTVQNLERTIIQRKADLLVARINLHRALGGSWINDLGPVHKR